MQIFTLFICLAFFSVGSNSWFVGRRRRRRRRPLTFPTFNRPRVTSTTTIVSTTKTKACPKTQKCLAFSEIPSNISQVLQCAPFLPNSCLSRYNLNLFNVITQIKMAELEDVLMKIKDRGCDCSNRSIEIFCRFLLPECSIPNLTISSCDVLTCSEPNIQLPCSDYCNSLIENCFTASELLSINKIFESLNQTVSDICGGLENHSCWRNERANFSDCVQNNFEEANQNRSAASSSDKKSFIMAITFGAAGIVIGIIITAAIWKHFQSKKQVGNEVVTQSGSYFESVTAVKRVESSDTLSPLNNSYTYITHHYTLPSCPQKHYENIPNSNPYVDMTGQTKKRDNQKLPDLDYMEICDGDYANTEPYVNFNEIRNDVK